MELKFGKKKEYPFLVLDIGTEAVKAVVVQKDKEKVNILKSSLQYLRDEGIFDKGFSEEEFEMEKIKRAVAAAQKDLLIKNSLPVVLTLNPRILRAEVVDGISMRDKREKKISKKEKKIIYKYILKAAEDDVSKLLLEKSGILGKDINFLSAEIIDKEIEGYKVSDIQNYQGKNLVFKTLVVFIIDSYFKRLLKALKGLGLNVVKTVHLAQAVSLVFKDGALFDVGGEAVQLFFIKSGVLESIELFDRGGSDFTERIFDVLAIDKEEARRLKENYSEGSLTPETENRIKEIFSNEKKVWRDIFKRNDRSSVFLFGGGSSLPEIKEMFKRKQLVDVKSLEMVQDISKKTKSPQFVASILISLLF
jgi:cell division protein FtsA